jgi:hypothetical protein
MLPKLKPSVLNPEPKNQNIEINSDTVAQMNLLYAKDYKVTIDIACMFKKFKEIGNLK